MGKYYKMTIDNDDNIHIIINKKGYKKDYDENEIRLNNRLIQDILTSIDTYSVCVDERVSGIEVLNAIRNIIYNYTYK